MDLLSIKYQILDKNDPNNLSVPEKMYYFFDFIIAHVYQQYLEPHPSQGVSKHVQPFRIIKISSELVWVTPLF